MEEAGDWLARVGGALDGVVAKRLDGPYVPGERAMWKVKRLRTADCVVGGYRLGSGTREVGSLLLGLFNGEGLLDHVGFTASIPARGRKALTQRLHRLAGGPGFTGKAPGGPSRWSNERSGEWCPVRPALVVEVCYDQDTLCGGGIPAHRDGGVLGVAIRTGLSACIITFNEADRIEACVRSVGFCDEVIVVDSHSTDDTRGRAAALGAQVIERDWPGYRSQKQFAVAAARNDWVLCLDADEQVSAELRAEIEGWREHGFADRAGWSVPRITDYFGKFLRHGNAYPDRLVRLFDRRRGGWVGLEIHENTRVDGPVGKLEGHLEHHSYRSLTDHQQRMQRYAQLMGEALYAAGKRCGLAKVLLNPQWRFFRGYVLRLGFLDGWRGLVFALVESGYVRRKYLHLYIRSRGLPD